MEQCSKISDHDDYSSNSSSVVGEKTTDSRRSSGGVVKSRLATAVATSARAKRDRKPVEDDVTLTFPQHVSEVRDKSERFWLTQN